MTVVLQVDFVMPVELLGEHLAESARALAESIAKEPGLISKIWTENKLTSEAGGIYLFKDEASAQQYLAMHQKRLVAMGAKNLRSKIFAINEPLTEITKGSLRW